MKINIKRSYKKQKDSVVGETALNVSNKMATNPSFPTPPTSAADLKTQAQLFIAAVGTSLHGTPQDTLHKNALKAALIATLDKQADYVESIANNNPEIIASSGFDLTNSNKTSPAPVGTVTIIGVNNSGAGCLTLDMDHGSNVWGFEVEVSTAPNVWLPAGYFTDPLDVTPQNLTPGQMYAIRVRVHGSKNQRSDWSDVVNHMAL